MAHIKLLPHFELCPNGAEFETLEDESICEAALRSGIKIEHACEMSCACTTCHIIVREGFNNLNEASEDEEDLSPDRPSVGTLGLATLTIISDDIANEAPTVSSIEDLVISEGAEQVSVDFIVTDNDSFFDELTVQASTSNPFLISGLIVEGTAGEQDASQWTLNFAPVADQFGEGAITVEINDGYQSISTSFNVTVSAVNNAPQSLVSLP